MSNPQITSPASLEICSSSHEKRGQKRRRKDFLHSVKDSFTLIQTIEKDNCINQSGFIDKSSFLSKYTTYQVMYLPRIFKQHEPYEKHMNHTPSFTWKSVSSLFSKLNDKDQSSWTEENCGNQKAIVKNQNDDPPTFPTSSGKDSFLFSYNSIPQRGYSSFIVQHDNEAMKELLTSLPLVHLPIHNDLKENGTINNDQPSNKDEHLRQKQKQQQQQLMKMKYGPCLWFFYGRNDNIMIHDDDDKQMIQKPIQGRPEHTDCISHHGTWHYQLSGVKEWHLRPTEDLIQLMEKDESISKEELCFWKNEEDQKEEAGDIDGVDNNVNSRRRKITIRCEEGDVLLVNTRLWWHSTTIPQQPLDTTENNHEKSSVPSVSYARDIYLSWDNYDCETNSTANNDPIFNDIIYDNDDSEVNMTNLDGLYASNDIEIGTIIFREDDMPDCELHRTKDADTCNCEVIELEDGTGAVVSCRDIKAGEFFCLMDSDNEDEAEEVEEDEE